MQFEFISMGCADEHRHTRGSASAFSKIKDTKRKPLNAIV